MRNSLSVFAALAALVAAGSATAAPQTLSEFMDKCSSNAQTCQLSVGDYIASASQNNFICLPKDVSHDAAIGNMLSWLRKANEKPDKANASAEDAQWDAVNALWPCHKD
jgi:hypothetical protein